MSHRMPTRGAELGLVVMWSSGFIGAAIGTRYASALTLLGWRYIVALALLVCIYAALQTRRAGLRRPFPDEPLTRSMIRDSTAVGLLTQAGYLGGIVGGVSAGVPPATAALIAALQPLVLYLVTATRSSQSLSGQTWAGLLLGLLGVALVVGEDLGAQGAHPLAFLLPVLGMGALVTGTLIEQERSPAPPLIVALSLQTLSAGIALIALAALTGQLGPPPGVGFWFAVGWVVLLSTFGGYGFYFLVVRLSGPRRASLLLYLTPALTAAWAAVQLGDTPGPLTIPGGCLCLWGVALVSRRGNPDGSHC